MRVTRMIWYGTFVDKLWEKQRVDVHEAEEVVQNAGPMHRLGCGRVKGEDVYLALRQTDVGRYLTVFFIYKRSQEVIAIGTRDRDPKERREYEEESQRANSR